MVYLAADDCTGGVADGSRAPVIESHFDSGSQISKLVAPSMSRILPLSVKQPLPVEGKVLWQIDK